MSIVLTRELLHFFMCVIELKGERERHSHTGKSGAYTRAIQVTWLNV